MSAGAERDDLYRDAGLVARVQQMLQLALHDRRASYPAVQGFLAENEDYFGRILVPKQALLPLQSHLHDPPGFLVGTVHPEQFECVLLGVQQARDKERVEDVDYRGGRLLAEVESELGRDDIPERAPPEGTLAAACRVRQVRDGLLVGDPVQLEHGAQIGYREADLAVLNTD
jgi:hypothetical protein